MNLYVSNVLGKQFTLSLVSTMENIYSEMDFKTPLIYILS